MAVMHEAVDQGYAIIASMWLNSGAQKDVGAARRSQNDKTSLSAARSFECASPVALATNKW
jgi:hypothetical protein